MSSSKPSKNASILLTVALVLITVFFIFGVSYHDTKAECARNYQDCIKLKCTDIEECVIKLVQSALMLAFPLGVLFIILAGFKYVTARGDPGKIKSAHEILTWTLIGLAIAIAAETLAIAFKEFFQKL